MKKTNVAIKKSKKLKDLKLDEFSLVFGDGVVPANPEATANFYKSNTKEESMDKLKNLIKAFLEKQNPEKKAEAADDIKKFVESQSDVKNAEELVKSVTTYIDEYTSKNVTTILDGEDAIPPVAKSAENPSPVIASPDYSTDDVSKTIKDINKTLNALVQKVQDIEKEGGKSTVEKNIIFGGGNSNLVFPEFTKSLESQLGLTPGQRLSKAAVTSGSFTVGLRGKEADKFFDDVIKESNLLSNIRTIKMNDKSMKIDKIALGGKVLKGATEGADPGETVSVTPTQISLNAKELIGVIQITDDVLEDNIEGDQFAQHLLRMVVDAAWNEIEEAFIAGDTTGATGDIRDEFDGYYKLAKAGSAHVIEGMADTPARTWPGSEGVKAASLIKNLPTKYRMNKTKLGFIQHSDIYEDYLSMLGGRNTGLGDNSITGAVNVPLKGIRNLTCPLLPIDQAFTYSSTPYTDGTFVMLTMLQNLIAGFYRELRIETDRIPRKRATDYVITMRLANAIQETDAIAIYDHAIVQ